MNNQEIEQLAQLIADKIELKMRREGTWPTQQIFPPMPQMPQWWEPIRIIC